MLYLLDITFISLHPFITMTFSPASINKDNTRKADAPAPAPSSTTERPSDPPLSDRLKRHLNKEGPQVQDVHASNPSSNPTDSEESELTFTEAETKKFGLMLAHVLQDETQVETRNLVARCLFNEGAKVVTKHDTDGTIIEVSSLLGDKVESLIATNGLLVGTIKNIVNSSVVRSVQKELYLKITEVNTLLKKYDMEIVQCAKRNLWVVPVAPQKLTETSERVLDHNKIHLIRSPDDPLYGILEAIQNYAKSNPAVLSAEPDLAPDNETNAKKTARPRSAGKKSAKESQKKPPADDTKKRSSSRVASLVSPLTKKAKVELTAEEKELKKRHNLSDQAILDARSEPEDDIEIDEDAVNEIQAKGKATNYRILIGFYIKKHKLEQGDDDEFLELHGQAHSHIKSKSRANFRDHVLPELISMVKEDGYIIASAKNLKTIKEHVFVAKHDRYNFSQNLGV